MAEPIAARVSRASSPAGVEDDLAILWRDAGKDGPVARAVMANLVVYRERAATEIVDLAAPLEGVPVDAVAQRHPSRVIVLHHGGCADPSGPVGAAISILLFGPPQARFGVEQIVVRSACAEASLPSIVRRFSLGDMPTSIWWTDDLSHATPLEALVTMGRQLVYDSRRWRDVGRGVLAVAPLLTAPHAPDLVDLNWRRLTPMRQALTQALAPPLAPIDARAARLVIRHRPGDGALAWLLAGWFASRLEWPLAAKSPVAIEEARHGDEALAVSLGAGEEAQLTATMNGRRVLVTFHGGMPPLSICGPHETDADAVAAELGGFTEDVSHRDALATLAARFAPVQ